MKEGSLVTRYSHGHDIVFRVLKIQNDIALLQGEVIRLTCDSALGDLKEVCEEDIPKLVFPPLNDYRETGLLKGKVLHLDGDPIYLKKAMLSYKNYGIKAFGYHLTEDSMSKYVGMLLKKHEPDILVITGHDALKNDDESRRYELSSYRNSSYFIDAVRIARDYRPDLDSLVIIAGACQSYYEAILEAGANFASSPGRENIHLLDPILIASQIASSRVSEYLKVETIVANTITHSMGGLETSGKARQVYQGGHKPQ